MTLKSEAKFEEKLTCSLNDEKFGKFSPPEPIIVSKLEV